MPSTRRSAACSSCCIPTRKCRSPTRTWSGPCAWRWSAGGGSRSSRSGIGTAEFRNTHFSYTLGEDGVEQFVATPELQSEDQIGSDPFRRVRSGLSAPAAQDEDSGLYRIEVNEGPGGGVKILNRPARRHSESVKYAEQNLYARASRTRRRPRPAGARVLGPAAGLRREQERSSLGMAGSARPVLAP